ncbi:MAG TPA: HEPN domain-containing protein [Gemmataceae bacterium]|nr:HEPN domain-containing protein [Gemmataceae bacterium]
MDPRDYLALASQLAVKEKPSPAELRTAVSRAYYAAFNAAVDLLKKMGVRHPDGWEGHKLVAEALRYSGDSKVQAASRELDDLRKARWAADYDMADDEVEHQRTVQKWVARARQLIKKLDECAADPQRLLQARITTRNWAGSAEGAGKGFALL